VAAPLPLSVKASFREYCSGDDKTNYFSDLTQLESDAVNAYLASHNLPETDAHIIYDYGRADLRTQIRALISSILLGIVRKGPVRAHAPRTAASISRNPAESHWSRLP
jgi:hypothetical protein